VTRSVTGRIMHQRHGRYLRPRARRVRESMAGVPAEQDRCRFPGMARGAGFHRVEISYVGQRAPVANAGHGWKVDVLLRRWLDDRRCVRSHHLYASGNRQMNCLLCEDCGWVCEIHPDRPWDGEHACTCGGAGMPCPQCNPSDLDHPPRPPAGTHIEFDEKGWRH
jgi:hypothetical protein